MMMNCSNKTKVEGEREVRSQNITKKQEISLKTQNIMKEESVSFLLWSTVQIEQRVERETEKTNVNTRFREMWNGIRVKSEVFWSFFRILIHPLHREDGLWYSQTQVFPIITKRSSDQIDEKNESLFLAFSSNFTMNHCFIPFSSTSRSCIPMFRITSQRIN